MGVIRKIEPILYKFVKRFWYFLCIAPLLFQMLFHIVRNSELMPVHWDAVALLVVSFSIFLVMLWNHKHMGRWSVWAIAAATIFVSIGVAMQRDRDLSWPGSDVAINNYRAALISVDEGALALISTWNARANPYVETGSLRKPQEVLARIDRLGLNWVVGSRWDRLDLPQDNNRMFMHPPLGPIVLGCWLELFGKSHFAATAYALFIRYCLIVFAILWAWRYIPTAETLNRVAIALLLSTAPRILSVIIPHPNELAALLAIGAVAICTTTFIRRRFIAYLLSGILLALAGYVSFCFVIVGFVVTGALFLSKEARKEKLPIAFLAGESAVVLVFITLGYYPWLTYLTGSNHMHYFNLFRHKDTSPIIAAAGFAAISIPLLLITFLSLFKLPKMRRSLNQIWMTGSIIALIVYGYIVYPNPPSRYLVYLFFLLTPLFSLTIRELKLSVYQAMMIPATNFIYMAQGLFFK